MMCDSDYEMLMKSDQMDVEHNVQCIEQRLAKRESKPHAAPFIVSIKILTTNAGYEHYCAGTIINENWILTAAHCVSVFKEVKNAIIVAGCNDIYFNFQEALCMQTRTIDYYVRHELYLGGVNPYDIALIYTRQPLAFNEFVRPANLPEQDTTPDGYGTLYGWGNVSMTVVPNYPNKLQEVVMPIMDWELCDQLLAASGGLLHETNLCAGSLSGGLSACSGDSGGPLIQLDCYEEPTIVGIVSWGKTPCGQMNAPSVFVRVSAFTDWIIENVNQS